MRKIPKYIILFLLFHLASGAQTHKIDSLYNVVRTSKQDTVKIKSLINLSWRLRDEGELEKSISCANEAKQLTETILKNNTLSSQLRKKMEKNRAHSIAQLGNTYFEIPDYEKAIKYYLSAEELFMELGDTIYASRMYNFIAYAYKNMGDFPMTIKYYEEALKIFGTSGSFKKERASLYGDLGIVYCNQSNYPKSFEMHFKSLNLRDTLTDKKGCATSYNNIGNVFKDKHENATATVYYEKALKLWEQLDSKSGIIASLNNLGLVWQAQGDLTKALGYYTRVITLFQESKSKNVGILAGAYGNIANIYGAKNDMVQALYFALKAMKVFEETGNKISLTISYNNVATVYYGQKKYAEALNYCEKSLSLAKEIGSLDDIRAAEQTFSDIYESMNEPQKALEHYKKFVIYRDSIFNEENTKKMVEAQMNYEFEKKEHAAKTEQDKKDMIAEEEKQKQRIVIASVSAGLFLVLILAVVIFRSLRQNQKKNKIITEQKEIVERQKELVEEKQKEILDSIHYARRIQHALITPEKYIERNLKRLNE